ncbi:MULTISPECIES: AIPR family protein [Pectobacterium]|uniref:AIPR family protein n=1 Tax=Pectobacterium TaxID=122277 RepID=UPI00193D873D|nr:AIPR family protein [Pectobacterium brasiliense]QRN34760.1 AIPR family protein [Pectobacterium brasiliense]
MTNSPREVAIHAMKRKLLRMYGDFIDLSNVGGNDANREVVKVTRSLAAFAVNYFNYDVEPRVCAESVCDGSDDHCIDAVYVNHDKKIVCLVQSKLDQSGSGSISRNEFGDFTNSCRDVILERYELFNARFNRFKTDIERAFDSSYKFKLVYIYSGAGELSSDINRIVSDRLSEFNADIDDGAYQFELMNLDKINSILSRSTLGSINLDDVEVLQYGITEHPLPSIHGIITGDQLAQWWEMYSDYILEKNIRGGLGLNSDVNVSIKDTLVNNPEMFWYYNNGITVLVDAYTASMRNASSRRESGRFNFVNASIINGAQTVTTIGNAYLNGDVSIEHLESVKVNVRFIKVDPSIEGNRDVSLNVTIANNSQNKVTGRDFVSKDPVQIALRDSVNLEEPYKYEIKRSGDSENITDPYHINMDDALNALVCSSLIARNLALLKSNRGRFFESLTSPLYRNVFNPSVSSVYLINSINLYRKCLAYLRVVEDSCDNGRNKKIAIHGRLVFIARVFKANRVFLNSRTVIDIDDLPPVEEIISSSFSMTNSYISMHYQSSHMPRFFENIGKVELVMNIEQHITQGNIVSQDS